MSHRQNRNAFRPQVESLESRRLLAATVSGNVFNDANLDGLRQSGEAALSGRRIFVDANRNDRFDSGEKSVLTDSAGNYKLTGLAAGTHQLREAPPSGWRVAFPIGNFFNLSVTATSAVTGKNFANTVKSIFGRIFNDKNANTAQETGEPALSGWTVYIDANRNAKLDAGEKTAVSDSTGLYSFGGLAMGDYQVREAPKPGWRITHVVGGAYTFRLGAAYAFRANYGNTTNALLTGTVFRDTDRDGIKDAGESTLSGVKVFLDANNNGKLDAGEAVRTTGSTGAYAFTTIAAGKYTVRAIPPSGMTATKPAAGVFSITLASGQEARNRNFGMR